MIRTSGSEHCEKRDWTNKCDSHYRNGRSKPTTQRSWSIAPEPGLLTMNVDILRNEYIELVKDYWLNSSEEALARATDLGKRLVHEELPPEEIGEFQQFALTELNQIAPATSFDEIASRLTPPLIEVLIAYGLAFRHQLHQHYESMVQQHLEQTSKLEALGTLASGIAHDFNTLLSVILGYAEMTQDAVLNDPVAQENLQQIMIATGRARDLVARILTFGRRGEKRMSPLRIADSLHEAEFEILCPRYKETQA